MSVMTEDQIPQFVDELLELGCEVEAISPDHYVIGDVDLPLAEYEAIEDRLIAVCERYRERGHLRSEIAGYLHSIGRTACGHFNFG